MDYFRNKTLKDLTTLHNQSFNSASKATKSNFYHSLKRIEKCYDCPLEDLGLSFLDSPEATIKKLEEKSYSANTILSTINSIVKLLKIIDAPLMLYNQWNTLLKERSDVQTKKKDDNLHKKLKVLINFKTIREMVNEKASEYIDGDHSLEDFRNFLILALFTIQIPVRISNYTNMRVVDDEDFTDADYNYLIVNGDYRFVFNKYRTSHMLGAKTIYVHDEILKYLIDKWLSKYNRESINFLINGTDNKRPMNGRQIGDAIEEVSKRVLGITLNIENIRASYMSHINDLDPDFNNKLDIANILGYTSTNVLDKHYL